MSDHPKKKSTQKKKQRPTIAVIADSMISGYQVQIWQGIRAAAEQHDVNLLCFIGRELDYEYEYRIHANNVYNLINSKIIDGIVAYTATISHFVDNKRITEFLHQFKVPVVGLAQETGNVTTVLMDNQLGTSQVVAHLIKEHGHKRIAYYKTTEGHPEGEERFQAYKDTLSSHGIQFDPDLVVPGEYFNFPDQGIKLLLDERKVSFDAIVAVDDYTALPVQEILKTRGFKVPEDVAVVGFDDVEDCRFVTPPMTTIRQPLHLQGQRAVELLISQIAGEKTEKRELLTPELIIRQSCGCLNPEVLQASGTIPSLDLSETKSLGELRTEIIDDIQTNFSVVAKDNISEIFDAFVLALDGQSSRQFLEVLNNILSNEFEHGAEFNVWQSIISLIRSHALPHLEPNTSLRHAENIFQQARVMIADVGQRAQAQRRLISQNQATTFQNLTQAISTTLDFKNLSNIIANNLPSLDISEYYISLYQNQDPEIDTCNLVLASTPQGRVELPVDGVPYPKEQIIPEKFFQSRERFTFMVEPLFFQDEDYGFIILDTSSKDETVYDALAQQISSAIKGTYLVQQVEQRALQLQTASEVSRAASSILDPEELVKNTVKLIKERFDLYYAGMFLVDDAGEWAVLQAGTGEPGKQMLAQNWRLEIGGGSMVGRCVSTGEPDIQLDIDKAPVHLRNPHLPETRSEMALPLTSRGETIGALSIQSDKSQAFTMEDAAVLQTMANQIASAIQNTRLYNQSQAALEEIQATQRRYLQQAWTEYNKTSDKTGYMKIDANVISLGEDMLPEVQQAMQEKKPIVVNLDEGKNPILAIPILLRDQPIGALGFQLPPGKKVWNEDDIAIAEVVSEQFGLAAETIRLLDETQRRAARERLVTEITTKIRSSNEPEIMLQTAVVELRQALQAKRARMLLQSDDGEQ